jgi:hypothetical protein
MEYIALGLFREEEKHVTSNLIINSNEFDLKLIQQDHGNIDIEVQDGLISFMQQFNLLLLKILKLSTSKVNFTSSDVNQNLINYFLGQDKSNLLEFLTANRNILPRKYYIVFAFEWHKGELCRYKKIRSNHLTKYFSDNNSWYLWLYDYEKDYEKPILDIPLVLEIDNN